jgi:LEA14-like dessication related protein
MRTVRLMLLLVALAGCREAAKRVFQQPTAELRGVALRGIDIGGASIEVALMVHNPNPYALDATRASYRLYALGAGGTDSVEVGRGTTTVPLRVAAHDSATVRLPLDVTWEALQRATRKAGANGAVDWHALGTIAANTPVGTYDLPLDVRGRFTAPRINVR